MAKLYSNTIKWSDDCSGQYVYFIDQYNDAGRKATAPHYMYEVTECWVNIEPEDFEDISREELVNLPDHEFGIERTWVAHSLSTANMIVRDPDNHFELEV